MLKIIIVGFIWVMICCAGALLARYAIKRGWIAVQEDDDKK